MQQRILDEVEAYSSGDNLWVVTDREHSSWTVKFDWYLNFQVARAGSWKHRPISQELADLALQADIEVNRTTFSGKSPAALIRSEGLLPSRQVLQVPFKRDLGAWLATIEEIWNGLNKPSVRIFLPKGISASIAAEMKSPLAKSAHFVADLNE